ncbi:hypothetical protein KKC44_02060 [Patescibacteria group bacterium]|nr:hypothetical protein [Patescibacteria group bacterium]
MKRSLIASSVLFASICLSLFVSTSIDHGRYTTLGQITNAPLTDELDTDDSIDDLFDGLGDMAAEDTDTGSIASPPYTDTGIDPTVPANENDFDTTPLPTAEDQIQQESPAPIFYRNGKVVEVGPLISTEPETDTLDLEPAVLDPELETETDDTIIHPEDTSAPADDGSAIPDETQPENGEDGSTHFAAQLNELPIVPIAIGVIAILFTLFVVIWLMKRKKGKKIPQEPSNEGTGQLPPLDQSDRLKQALSTLEAEVANKEIPTDKTPEIVIPADADVVTEEQYPLPPKPPDQPEPTVSEPLKPASDPPADGTQLAQEPPKTL